MVGSRNAGRWSMDLNSIERDPDLALNENLAAELLGVSVRTLQAWRVRGGGPRYCKIGRIVRYRRRDIVQFQERHAVNSTSEADTKRR